MDHLQDKETEESVLAHIIGIPDSLDEVRNLIDEDSFADEDCRMLYKAIIWSVNNEKTPDLMYLQSIFRDRNRLGDLDKLNRIASSPISANILQQVETLEEYRKRRVYRDLRVSLMMNEDVSSTELDSLIQSAMSKKDKFTAGKILDKYGLMNHACQVISDNLDPNKQRKEIRSGFRVIDSMGGLPPESEVIVAAFSSQGKTAFAMSIINYAMICGVNSVIYSAEMGKSSIVGRILNMMGWGVPITLFKTQPLFDSTIEDFNRLSQEFCNRPGNIFVDDTSNNNVDYICSSIRVMHRKHNIQLVMVDYLQIISLYDESSDSDQMKLANASRKLQRVAKELNICILVLSQFSRPTRDQGHLPSEDLIRGSGQIYEACDIAIYVYRPEKWDNENYPHPFQDAEKKGTAMIKIGKFRDGESGKSSIVGFEGRQTLFYDFPEGKYSDDINKNYPKATVLPTETKESKPF